MSRQIALEKELQQLTQINAVVAKLITAVQSTEKHIETTNEAVVTTDKLLNQWIRILSQANYTREIISDPSWTGGDGTSTDETIAAKLAKEKELTSELDELLKEQQLLNQKLTAKDVTERPPDDTRRGNPRASELGLNSKRKKV